MGVHVDANGNGVAKGGAPCFRRLGAEDLPEPKIRSILGLSNEVKRAEQLEAAVEDGGGPRCQVDECNSYAKDGRNCFKHGGGRRCQVDGYDEKIKVIGNVVYMEMSNVEILKNSRARRVH